MNSALTTALEYHDAGINVVPVRYGTKDQPIAWRRWQTHKQSSEDVVRLIESAAQRFDTQELNLANILGDVSGNIYLIDCESVPAFDRYSHTITEQIGDTWISRTARGGHIWLTSSQPVAPCAYQNLGFEIRSQRQYAMVPHSLHPSGVFYEWISRPATIAQADVLPFVNLTFTSPIVQAPIERRTLPRLVLKVLSGDESVLSKYASRSEVDQAVITAMVNANHPRDSIMRVLMCYDSHYMHVKDQYRGDYLAHSIGKAAARGDTAQYLAAQATAQAVEDVIIAAPLAGRGARNNRAVLSALANKYARAGGAISFSAREAAESARCSAQAANRALAYWQDAGVLKLAREYSGEYSNTYELVKPANVAKLDTTSHSSQCEVVSTYATFEDYGVFERLGLGKAAGEIYAACIGRERTQAQIAEATGIHKGSVSRGVRVLLAHGLVIQDGRRYQSRSRDNVDWYALGDKLGTLTLGAERASKFRAQRTVYQHMLRTRRETLQQQQAGADPATIEASASAVEIRAIRKHTQAEREDISRHHRQQGSAPLQRRVDRRREQIEADQREAKQRER